MTDYLEPIVREGGNFLLESERRLDAALAGLSGGGGLADLEEAGVSGPISTRPNDSAQGERRESGELPVESPLPERQGPGHRPLQAALAALDQSLAQTAGAGTVERRDGGADGTCGGGRDTQGESWGRPGRRYSRGEPLQPAEQARTRPARSPPWAEAQNWAEQIDRSFQRDSRRFDGGFYLY